MKSQKKCARRYANLKGLKLVSVVSNESYSEIDQEYADFLMTGESPDSFVNWIRGQNVCLQILSMVQHFL